MVEIDKARWGGVRTGAGRKQIPHGKHKITYQARLRREQIEWLEAQDIPANKLLEILLDTAIKIYEDKKK